MVSADIDLERQQLPKRHVPDGSLNIFQGSGRILDVIKILCFRVASPIMLGYGQSLFGVGDASVIQAREDPFACS